MRLAATLVKTIKPRDGTTRQNLHHRKMVLKRAAVGTPPLSTFGFTAPTSTARPRKRVVHVDKITNITVYLQSVVLISNWTIHTNMYVMSSLGDVDVRRNAGMVLEIQGYLDNKYKKYPSLSDEVFNLQALQ